MHVCVAHPDHDPNTQHVLCGADADLIMLGLATHEPNFTIIREEFKPNKPRPCDICGQIGMVYLSLILTHTIILSLLINVANLYLPCCKAINEMLLALPFNYVS